MENAELEVVLSKLSKTNYSWEELQQRPLPDGVDPSRLEQYLNNEDFQVKFLLIEDTCLLLERISKVFVNSAVRDPRSSYFSSYFCNKTLSRNGSEIAGLNSDSVS